MWPADIGLIPMSLASTQQAPMPLAAARVAALGQHVLAHASGGAGAAIATVVALVHRHILVVARVDGNILRLGALLARHDDAQYAVLLCRYGNRSSRTHALQMHDGSHRTVRHGMHARQGAAARDKGPRTREEARAVTSLAVILEASMSSHRRKVRSKELNAWRSPMTSSASAAARPGSLPLIVSLLSAICSWQTDVSAPQACSHATHSHRPQGDSHCAVVMQLFDSISKAEVLKAGGGLRISENRSRSVAHLDIDVLLREAGQVRNERKLLLLLQHVNARNLCSPSKHMAHECTPTHPGKSALPEHSTAWDTA
jgi:hypothetical protein